MTRTRKSHGNGKGTFGGDYGSPYASVLPRTYVHFLFLQPPTLLSGYTQAALPPSERALYAALAPAMTTSGSLKAVCRTWEDHLWALVSIACEERLSRGLAAIERECFWESGLGALDSDAASGPDGDAAEGMDEEDAWEDEVIQTLQDLATAQVSEG